MRRLAIGLAVVGFVALAAPAREDPKKPAFKVTADEIAKEFKEDAAAAKKKYGGERARVIELTGTARLAIGPKDDTEILVENAAKIPMRVGVKKRPDKFPAKFTAIVTFKGYFDMAKELSLTASQITYK